MLKTLCLSLFVLAGSTLTAEAQDAHPLLQLQQTARVLIVFSPSSTSVAFQKQLQMIDRHAYDLAQRNTVVVPVSAATTGPDEHFPGENMPLATLSEQNYVRNRYHVEPGQFVVVLINQDGIEQIRSDNPVDIHQLTAKLDSMPAR